MANEDIKKQAKEHGVWQWQIASELGMKDSNFSSMLRYELSAEKKHEIQSIIIRLASKKQGVI